VVFDDKDASPPIACHLLTIQDATLHLPVPVLVRLAAFNT
jgi:hypothetical protein